MFGLCAPALIYVAFSLTQIIIDTFKGLYNTAFFKIIVMIIITILLNALCQGGMIIISWIIVFVPFIFMSVIVAILLYVFGLDPSTGKLNITCDNKEKKGGNLILRREKNDKNKNANNTMDISYSESPLDPSSYEYNITPTFWSSDPEFQ